MPHSSWKKTISLIFLVSLLISLPISVYTVVTQRMLFQKKAKEESSAETKLPEVPKPEYAEGEVLVKFKVQSQKLKVKEEKKLQGLNLDKTELSLNDLETTDPETKTLVTSLQQQNIQKIDKVFKGFETPQTEIQKFKARFPQRKINEPELLKIDLSRTYKLTFEKTIPVEQQIQALQDNPLIEYAEPNYIFHTTLVPNDPYYLDSYPDNTANRDPNWNPPYDYQWNLKQINMEKAWDITTGSEDIIVAVVDTGVDYAHPEFGSCTLEQVNNNQCAKIAPAYDFVNNDNDAMDDNGHGTHVAGTIGALTSNQKGIAGLSPLIKILPTKVLRNDGVGALEWVAEGIIFTAQQGAAVTNLSLGTNRPSVYPSFVLKEALDYAFNTGVVVVAAAGNSTEDVRKGYWPANYKNVISVGASSENDTLLAFSNYGASLVAPGGESTCKPTGQNNASDSCYNIISLKSAFVPVSEPRVLGPENEKDYLRLAGTSMATPHVSALASLILTKDSSLTNLEVKSTIEYTSIDLGDSGVDDLFGYGRINAQTALNLSSPPPVGEIYFPTYKDYLGGTSEVIGTVGGQSFASYKIKLGQGENPVSWSTTGITLTNNGSHPVENNILALIDTSGYSKGTWILKLEVFGTKETKIERKIPIFIDPNLHSGWPQAVDSRSAGNVDEASFLVADMDNDGEKEVIAQGAENLYLWNSRGILLPNFPKYVGKQYVANAVSRIGRPAVGDIDGDGEKEAIFVIHIYEFAYAGGPSSSAIHVINKDGSYLPGWPIEIGLFNQFSDPVLEDIDGDGKQEILIIEGGNKFHAYKHDTSEVLGWPRNIFVDAESQYIAVGDLEGDGFKDFVITASDKIHLYSTKTTIEKWSKQFLFPGETKSYVSWTKPTLADLNDDGKLEIIVSSGPISSSYTGNKGAVFVFTHQGQFLNGWPQNTRSISNDSGLWNGNIHRSSPAIGDVNDDGILEIIVGTSDGRVMIFKADGTRYNIFYGEGSHSNFNRGVALSDLDNDGKPDVIAGASRMYYDEGAFFAWPHDWNFGDPCIPGWPKNILVFSTPQLTDLDEDGKSDVVALGRENLDQPNKIFVWKENNLTRESFEWPMYGYNERRTGEFAGTTTREVTPTPVPTSTPTPTPTIPPTFGQSLKFDPQNIIGQKAAYVEIPSSGRLLMGDDFTIEAWFKPYEETLSGPNAANPHFILAKEGIPEEAWGYSLAITNKKAEFGVNLKTPTTRVREVLTGITHLVKDKWHFLQVIRNGDQFSLYVNGQLEAKKEVPLGAHELEHTALTFGCAKTKNFPASLSQFFGEIDEVRISFTPRNPTIPPSQFTPDFYTLALWHFDGDAQDTTGHHHGQTFGNVEFIDSDISLPLSTLTGDLDHSDHLNQQDIKIQLESWGQTPQNSPVDFIPDGLNNALDFGQLLQLIKQKISSLLKINS